MSLESLIFDTLKDVCDSRVYPDFAPEETPRPYITYQQVGGDSLNFIKQSEPSMRSARVQFNVWADTRKDASNLALQLEQALRMNEALNTTVLGAPTSLVDDISKLRGTRQDFTFWS